MATYIIIGGDGKEYGPITENDVRQWITEGRLAAQSRAKGEGDAEFRPLEKFPEFAALFASVALGMAATPPGFAPPPPIAPPSPAGSAPVNALPDDYELDIIGCLTRGFDLIKENFGTLFLGALVYCAIEVGIGFFSGIPFVGAIFSIANFVCAGPLTAGLFYLFIRVNRGEPASLGDVFAGFPRGFLHSFLARLIQTVLIGICFLPVIIMFGVTLFSAFKQVRSIQPGSPPDPEIIRALMTAIFAALPVSLVCAIPAMFLSVCFIFSLPLIVDRQVNCIEAMKMSWRMVTKHWFHVFGLLALIGLLNLVGGVLCCVGFLFTFPLGIAALMVAYETIFGSTKK